ncbi:PadR family transcriptional regulator [Microbacterium sp.]|uniref:PadR family transcriptional regulator n=1 Tax=Microbacterium sp. TaxID=51671 RepID=UPI003458B45C
MTRNILTPMGVMVLGLLREDDMHPYEMLRLMRHRRDDRLLTLTTGTIYHTVARLERAGFVAEVGVDRDGNRPERTTYTLTSAGLGALQEWMREELVRIDRPVEFRIALSEASNLDRDEVLALLQQRRRALAEEDATGRAGLAAARAEGVPEQYLIEADRDIVVIAAELAWLDAFLLRLPDPGFAWGPDPVEHRSARYIAQRKAARQ